MSESQSSNQITEEVIADGKYPASKGFLQVQTNNTQNRSKKLSELTSKEKQLVQTATEQGKSVLWDKGNGETFLFQPTAQTNIKNKTSTSEKEIQETEKKSIWTRNPWLKWVLIGLATVGLGIGAYFLFRKKKSSTPQKEEKAGYDGPLIDRLEPSKEDNPVINDIGIDIPDRSSLLSQLGTNGNFVDSLGIVDPVPSVENQR